MKALRRLTVRAALPPQLAPLGEIVANLRWSWHPESLDLLESVDAELWNECNGDPTAMLGAVSNDRLAALAKDRKFLRRLSDISDDLRDYLEQPRWYQRQQEQRADAGQPQLPESIAYFSPEFGITEVLPQYSGGLGILAGDHLKSASDLGVPIIGVGLLYRAGYFTQSLSREGWQQERYPSLDAQGLPITPLRDAEQNLVRISLDLPQGRLLNAQVWVASVGRVPLLLLDSDVEDNDSAARSVTDRLYGGGPEHRLVQELLLGIGGVRALRAFCAVTGRPAPQVFHTNEGHAGFLGIERISELTAGHAGLSFEEALTATRAGTVFTTHTPVPAGIDRFDRELVETYLSRVPGVPVDKILALGAEEDPGQVQHGPHGAAARPAGQRGGPVARPGQPVHVQQPVAGLRRRRGADHLGHQRRARPDLDGARDPWIWPSGWSATRPSPPATAGTPSMRSAMPSCGTSSTSCASGWSTRSAAGSGSRGWSAATPAMELGWTATAFDPDVLTIGFARRVPSYKRLTLMLRDPQRLKKLLTDPDRPVQIVVAGKSHPADDGGKELIAQLVRFTDDPEVRHRIAFLPDYDIGMARYLYWGSDVWLNNPLRPLEACGTSGMKAALNGGLNLSIKDGWWDEWCEDGKNGWEIPSADDSLSGTTDEHRDSVEAAALYELIEHQVAQRFYTRDSAGIPTQWIADGALHAEVARAEGAGHPDGAGLHRPAVRARCRVRRQAHRGRLRRGEGTGRLEEHRDRSVEERLGATCGIQHRGRPQPGWRAGPAGRRGAGGLRASDVEVQAVYGSVDADNRLSGYQILPLQLAEERDGAGVFAGDIPLRKAGPFGYTVRVLPANSLLASDAELGLVATAAQL